MHANPLQKQQSTVDQYVEYLCEQGCMKVSIFIEALQNNQSMPELDALTQDERVVVLDELVSIMSVYQGKCSS
ncbi:MAG: hypothetical protein OEY45_02640 [Gammaproteobacteria bacterium]|nr:hypothetical protein [Gammaproteobacteria bacterium]MDH5514040.1 hypothetical protein [Gammaproteobacteria bacterium]